MITQSVQFDNGYYVVQLSRMLQNNGSSFVPFLELFTGKGTSEMSTQAAAGTKKAVICNYLLENVAIIGRKTATLVRFYLAVILHDISSDL